MAGSHDVDITFELTKDEVHGVVTRPLPAEDSIQILCYTSDSFIPLLGLDDPKILEDVSGLRLGPPLRLREPSGDVFDLPKRPLIHNKLQIRIAVCEPYTNFVYFGTESAIWRLDATDMVTRVAGHRTEPGEADGPGDLARFDEPCCLAADGLGALYVAAGFTGLTSRLACIQLPPTASVLAFAAAAAALSTSDQPPTIDDVLAVSVTTLPRLRISGKVQALSYDFANRCLLVATQTAVYSLPTTAAGCLAAEPAAVTCIAAAPLPNIAAATADEAIWLGAPTTISMAFAAAATTTAAAEAATTEAAAAAASSVPPLCRVEGVVVDERGDIYVADKADDPNYRDEVYNDDGDEGESGVRLKRLRPAEGSPARASGVAVGPSLAGGGGGDTRRCVEVVCSDLGLLDGTRLAVLPYGWLLAHDYQGNVLRLLRLGLRPSWPQGAQLLLAWPQSSPSPPQPSQYGSGGGSLAADLGALLASQPDATSDVSVLVGGRFFACHRAILAARCEYFRRLFAGGFKDSDARQVTLSDADPAAFAALLTFLYTDRADFPPGPALRAVVVLADRLLLPAAARLAQQQLLAATTPASLVDNLLWAEGQGLQNLAAALRDAFSREQGRVLLQAPDSMRRLVAHGSPELVAEILATAIRRTN